MSDVVLDKESGEIAFTVGEGRGNALVALVQEDAIVWSWHIWVTDAPQTMAYENGVVFMDRNLGAVGTTVGGTDAYGMYYSGGARTRSTGERKPRPAPPLSMRWKNLPS